MEAVHQPEADTAVGPWTVVRQQCSKARVQTVCAGLPCTACHCTAITWPSHVPHSHITSIVIYIHRVSKNVPPLPCYNFDAHEWILIFFGRNVTNKVGNQKTLYYATSNNLCFCTTWQNAETRKSHISLNWIVLHAQCTCALFSWKKKLSYVMRLIASNICWDSKISH